MRLKRMTQLCTEVLQLQRDSGVMVA